MPDLPPYSRYAQLYNDTGQAGFARRAWPYALGRLQRLGFAGGTVLDLACGTGALLADLAESGLTVFGLDLSREMLLWAPDSVAGRVARADCRRLPFAKASFDLITSFYDSLNYLLTDDDLTACLAECRRVLRPSGQMVFDLNTPHTLAEHWSGLCQARVEESLASVWEARWEPWRKVSSLRVTYFVRGEDGRWDRFDELHDERGYTAEEVTASARAAGLAVDLIEDYQTQRRPAAQSRRLFYWLRKPAE